jgi:hypothetical protein
MSAITDAFGELLDEIAAARSTDATLAVGGDTVRVIVGTDSIDPMVYDGGMETPSDISTTSKLADWSTLPAKNDSATLAGTLGADGTFDVMSVSSIGDGMVTIKLGNRSTL